MWAIHRGSTGFLALAWGRAAGTLFRSQGPGVFEGGLEELLPVLNVHGVIFNFFFFSNVVPGIGHGTA